MEKTKNRRKKIVAIICLLLLIFITLYISTIKGETYTLESGAWVVGQNVPAGEYIITTDSETGGNVTIIDTNGNVVDYEAMSSTGLYGVNQMKVTLENGYTIKNEVQGTIYLSKPDTFNFYTYQAGIWNVGEDIKPGSYSVTLPEGEMGSIVVSDINGNIVATEMLDSNGVYGKSETQINLLEGQTVEITGISELYLK